MCREQADEDAVCHLRRDLGVGYTLDEQPRLRS